MRLADIQIDGAELTGGRPEAEVRAVVQDSRRVQAGSLFVAVPGLEHDGLAYYREALGRGALGVVAESERPDGLDASTAWVRVGSSRRALAELARQLHGAPDRDLDLVGVTGTNGKTSTCRLIASVLESSGRRTGVVGTIGHQIGDEEVDATHTTPDAVTLMELLARMRAAGCRACAMEVSSHALEQERTHGLEFDVAVFTNLTREHLDYHVTLEAYAAAKARLFDGLDPRAVAVVNADDPHAAAVTGRTRARSVRYGLDAEADYRVSDLETDLSGTRFTLTTPNGDRLGVRSPLPARVSAYNLTAAAVSCLELGVPADAVERGLSGAGSVPGRFERIDAGQPFSVLVDYAHTDAALEMLLETVRAAGAERITVVFGCGGERDASKRATMGAIAARLGDRVIVTTDNPRREDPEAIADEVWRGIESIEGGDARGERIPDRRDAIRAAVEGARAGDAVVLAGKGHEGYQQLGSVKHPWDDRRVARECLGELGYGHGQPAAR